jgi:2-keto-4-pentenoate hydratase/2-oxohepta-3-ene-1,7-dioic acid hydratase in catechol pathway
MIRAVPQVIALTAMTLRQGAVILTGAPPAIANASIAVGSNVVAEITGIGRLSSVCHAA